MGRWTQYDEDPYRLPEGVTRIGYDADTGQYTYRDENARIYQGAPYAQYGVLTPVLQSRSTEVDEKSKPLPKISVGSTEKVPTTFHDILPPNAIASPSDSTADGNNSASIASTSSPSPNRRIQFIHAVRKTALPKMQGVVRNLRRSVTLNQKRVPSTLSADEKSDMLFRNNSQASSVTLKRSVSSATDHSKSSTAVTL